MSATIDDFMSDPRWPKFEEKIKDTLTKNKSDLSLNDLY